MVHDNGEKVLAGLFFTNDIMYEIWHTHTHTHTNRHAHKMMLCIWYYLQTHSIFIRFYY